MEDEGAAPVVSFLHSDTAIYLMAYLSACQASLSSAVIDLTDIDIDIVIIDLSSTNCKPEEHRDGSDSEMEIADM
jgi:hypothetical protein